MKRWIIYGAALLLAACSTEEVQVDDGPGIKTRSNSDVTIRITFPEAETPATRAISDADENKVTHIDLLVFTKDGNTNLSDDKFAYKIAVNSGINGTGNVKTFNVSLENMASAEQRIVLIANLPDDLRTAVIESLDDTDVGNTSMADIIKKLRYTGAPWRTANLTSGNFTPFPMFGQMFYYEQIDHENQVENITINMIRSVARIDVGVDIGGPAQGFDTDFTINKVYLCNVSDSGYVAPHDSYISQAPEQTVIGKTNPAATRVSHIEYDFSGRTLYQSIYVPESDSLIVNNGDSIKPAFLVIDAQYKGQQRFYRVDFTKNATYVPLLRNHKYTVNILGIRAEGYTTLEEAKNAPLTTLNLKIVLDGNSTINDISSYYDQYFFGLSVNEVIFDWEGNYIGKPVSAQAEDPYIVRVYSTYKATNPGGDNGEWSIDHVPAGFSANKVGTELHITVDDANRTNTTGRERPLPVDSIVLKSGFLTKGIAVRQTGGANSAVAKFANGSTTATVRLPIGYVAAARPNIFDGLGTFKDTVLWQESGTGVTFKTSMSTGSLMSQRYIEVEATIPNASANKYANAVVGLAWENPAGMAPVGGRNYDVIWSWHIWAMPETYETGYTSGGDVNADFHNPNRLLLMKRVLGKGTATHLGLFYQWGRKDPFTRNLAGITPAVFHAEDVAVANNNDNAIRQPTTFFKGTDWHGSNHDNTLWSDSPEPGTKTYYDPCPEGWRVPPKYADLAESPWQNDAALIRSEYINGYISNGSQITGIGYLWTASVFSGMMAYITNIPTSGQIGVSDQNKASAMSVRCVKDLKRKY